MVFKKISAATKKRSLFEKKKNWFNKISNSKFQASLKSKSPEQEKATSPTSSQDGSSNLRKGFHSTPDLKSGSQPPTIPLEELKAFQFKAKTDMDICNWPSKEVNDQRGYFTLPGRKLKLPPPDHAPPPPPVDDNLPPPPPPVTSVASEVMVVKSPEKTNVTSPTMSSFKPENDYTEPNR